MSFNLRSAPPSPLTHCSPKSRVGPPSHPCSSAPSPEFNAHVGNVSASWLDTDSLRPAIGHERDRGGKCGGAEFAFEAAFRDASGQMAGHVSRCLLAVSPDRFAESFDVAVDVKLEAFARAYN